MYMAVTENVCQQEQLVCRSCLHTTRNSVYREYYYRVLATGLGAEQHRAPGRTLGQMLQAIWDQDRRSCDIDNGKAA